MTEGHFSFSGMGFLHLIWEDLRVFFFCVGRSRERFGHVLVCSRTVNLRNEVSRGYLVA
jgi:hypothetical protein